MFLWRGGPDVVWLRVMDKKIKRMIDFRKNMLIFAGSSILGMAYAYKIGGNRVDNGAFKLTLGMAAVFTVAALVSHFYLANLQKTRDEMIAKDKKAGNSKQNNSNKKSKNTKKEI